jgi:hypothetical protein
MNEYIYKGDHSSDISFRGRVCKAIRWADGKCIRGRNGNMLVEFEGRYVVIVARQLRKIKSKDFLIHIGS